MKKRVLTFIMALILTVSCIPMTASAVDLTLPSLWQEYEDYFMFGTFGGWKNGNTAQQPTGTDQRLYHYKGSSPANELKLDSQIGGNWGTQPSRNTYVSAIERINSDTSLSAEQKAAALKEANEKVVLLDRPGVMNTLDAIRAYNQTVPENEKRMIRAHVLVWHGGQQPNYFFCNGFVYNSSNPDWASRETMLARLDNYIKLMMERYSSYNDVIYSWDVVNEGLDDYSGQVRNMDDSQSGQWGGIFRRRDLDNDPDARLFAESEYIRKAFESARKWSEYYDADWTLYYNDFHDSNKPYEPKLSQTVKMLKPIYEAGNIDGYGMQGRLSSVFPSIEQLRKQLDMGLTVANEISFTEADIRSDFMLNPDYDPSLPSVPNGDTAETNTYDVNNATTIRKSGWGRLNQNGWNSTSAHTIAMREDIQKEQADYAADLMDLLIEYKDHFTVMQWDGTNDGSTFNSNKGAHMWSGLSGNAEKMSFFAVLGAPSRDKMKQAIAAGPADDQKSLYTTESWAAYESSKTAAANLVEVRIYDMAAVTAVKNATTTLLAATAALEKATPTEPADKSILNSKLQGLAALNEADYTADSWAALQIARESAQAVADRAEATQSEVDAAVISLQSAIDALVKNGGGETIEVESIAINAPATIKRNKSEKLTAAILPKDATVQDVVWTSLNPGVATVDEDGTVTAIKAGFAIIRATANNGITHEVTIRVTA
ncbi:endo-1,4-beta-xylanase [Oscillospiraceae bacterium MB08-C2-2]|nr:endo-1,4-beta-xylanase [Oscillospiraceae bacterium MB08-C2-2]